MKQEGAQEQSVRVRNQLVPSLLVVVRVLEELRFPVAPVKGHGAVRNRLAFESHVTETPAGVGRTDARAMGFINNAKRGEKPLHFEFACLSSGRNGLPDVSEELHRQGTHHEVSDGHGEQPGAGHEALTSGNGDHR